MRVVAIGCKCDFFQVTGRSVPIAGGSTADRQWLTERELMAGGNVEWTVVTGLCQRSLSCQWSQDYVSGQVFNLGSWTSDPSRL